MYNTILNILIYKKQCKLNIRPHTKYSFIEEHHEKPVRNNIVFLDEYTPDGRWQNSHMRTGFDNVITCRYKDYPWFGHNRNPDI